MLEHTPDALLLLAPDGSVSFLNAAAEELFGYSRAQLLGADSALLMAEASREGFHRVLAGLGGPGGTPDRSRGSFAGSGRRGDGTQVPVEITCSTLPAGAHFAKAAPGAGGLGDISTAAGIGVRTAGAATAPAAPQPGLSVALSVRRAGRLPGAASGHAQGRNAAAADAATLRRPAFAGSSSVPAAPAATAAYADRDDQLRAAALRDQLTALPNGTLFNERLAAALRRPDPVDVLLLNVEDLKGYSDKLGRSSADELLVEVATRLRNCVRPHDTVARLGGEQFVVLLTECLNADAVARRISESLLEPMRIAGTLVRPGVRMGLASKTTQTKDGPELLRQADAALTAAQDGGQHGWQRFRPEMLTAAAQRGNETGLWQAVELGQISVHYQPVVSAGLGAVVQFEAFARWERHGAVVPPNQFLPVAEQSGLIREIGDEVLRRACAEIRPWLAGDAAYSVAVNVSGLQFQNREFATEVLAIVASTGVDARQLTLELTESVFFDAGSDVLRQLRQLRTAGVRIAMDDFGTGYASLGRLKELPLDIVKIDRSFVAMIRTGQEQLPFFSTMVDAAHHLGLSVTAEGIETPAQAKYLMDRGCDSLQGYLFARPAPASDLAGTMESALTAIDKVDAAR